MGRFRDSKWVYVLLSILLAIVFWLYVRAEQDPTSPAWFYNLPVVQTGNNVLTQQGLTVAGLSQETVSLRVEAPASVLDSLSRNKSEISVSVDVSRCQEGGNKLVYTPNWPTNVNRDKIVVLEQKPDSITVTVEKLYTNTFNVEFQLKGKVEEVF